MLELEQIQSFYPENIRKYSRNIIREYLQYKTLNLIFSPDYQEKLCFIGGTAVRIVHGNSRFSEDIDLDNLGLDISGWKAMCEFISGYLNKEGFQNEYRITGEKAFHCYLKFPGLLYKYDITGHKDEKINIRIDAEPQNYNFQKEKYLINKFGIFGTVFTAPASLLLSQKIYAALNRKRTQARDFFDIVYLYSLTEPDYEYLKKKSEISSGKMLKKKLKEKIETVDLKNLSKEIQPFLYNRDDEKRVLLFDEFVETIYSS
jgi:predicted nucleotidyltransferase component of viral defense system